MSAEELELQSLEAEQRQLAAESQQSGCMCVLGWCILIFVIIVAAAKMYESYSEDLITRQDIAAEDVANRASEVAAKAKK